MQGDLPQVPAASDARWRDALAWVVDNLGLLVLHAQPIVELTTGEVAGYELLSRFTGALGRDPRPLVRGGGAMGIQRHFAGTRSGGRYRSPVDATP